MHKLIKISLLAAAVLCAQSQANEGQTGEKFRDCFVTKDDKGNNFVICPGNGEQVVVFEDMEKDYEQEIASTSRKANAR